MKLVARFVRLIAKAIFRFRNHATIVDIPTDRFNNMIKQLKSEGWKKTYEYSGFDAWIDYGAVRLKRNRITLLFEWDNWTEGSMEGPRGFVESYAKNNSLPVSYRWRWSEYDNNF